MAEADALNSTPQHLMHRNATGALVLDHPDDALDCTVAGVRLVRQTKLHEPGQYLATVERSGRAYEIIGGNSKRFPWRVTYNGARVCVAPTLPIAARQISEDDAARGPVLRAGAKKMAGGGAC